MIQTIIAITGLAAIWLATRPNPKHQRYACLFGLVGQPFWIVSSYSTEQWGVFLLAIAYELVWIDAAARQWIKLEKSLP